MDKAQNPMGLSHLVLNVRDIEESHRFWTEVVGVRLVSERRPTAGEWVPTMRFYVCDGGDTLNHHDIALVESADYDVSGRSAVHHIAIAFPDRDAWLNRISYLQAKGVHPDRRIEHGMTHSFYLKDPNGHGVELMYDLPREVWEGDVDAALNFLMERPTVGEEMLSDTHLDVPVFRKADAQVESDGR